MNFDVLDKQMRKYEASLDTCILPELYLAARIDGRSFTRLTRELHPMEAPFDTRFRDCMVGTVKHLMDCGFNVLYGYTESDEISLLFHPTEDAFNRKTRKYNSILAGEASAAFTHLLGYPAAFDCRLIPLPTMATVRTYFFWRQEDANRNALNAHCYWSLRHEGKTKNEATALLEGKTVAWKNEFLFNRGINYNDLPSWQKRGVGLWWETYEKEGVNPQTQEATKTTRRRLHEEYELPIAEQYENFIESLLLNCKC